MKKLLTVVLSLALVICLAACGSTAGQAGSAPVDSGTSDLSASTAPSTVGEGDLGEYHVAITGFSLGKTYDGKDAIIVTYDFTNNSANAQSATVALYCKAFQDGVQLDSAYISGGDDNESKDIKSGVTLSCQCSFALDNMTSPVELEISELISFSDDIVTETFDITKQ
jgi:hypothetical protein